MTVPDGYPAWLVRSMVSIPSVSGREQRLAAFLAGQLARLGLAARVDEVGNVVAETACQRGPVVLLLGHLDTVSGGGTVGQVGDLLYGRGSVDAKGSLAAMICAAAGLSDRCRLIVAGAVGEEAPGSVGARHLVRTLPRPDAVIVGEPSGWNGVCLGYKGFLGIEYATVRPVLHTSSPAETAVEAAAAFWRLLDGLVSGEERERALAFDAAAATLVEMRGDIRSAIARVSCRIPPGFDVPALEQALTRLAPAGNVTFTESMPAVRRGNADPVARALRMAIRAAGGRPRGVVKAGTSDMNVFGERMDVPMAAYGPGDGHLDHTDDEHLSLAELDRSVGVLTAALPELMTFLAPAVRDSSVGDGLVPSAAVSGRQ